MEVPFSPVITRTLTPHTIYFSSPLVSTGHGSFERATASFREAWFTALLMRCYGKP